MREIYGHSYEELENLVSSSLGMGNELKIGSNILNGWSSINMICFVSGEPEYVVKLPKSLGVDNFDHLYQIHNYLSRQGICTRPVFHGVVDDNDLSILILEYAKGKMYDSPLAISTQDLQSLDEVLGKLAKTTPVGVPSYANATEHLESMITPLENNIEQYARNLTYHFASIFDKYQELVDLARQNLFDDQWESVIIHGDLYERNIVFQHDAAILLDMEECCRSDRYYDRVYLYAQSYSEESLSRKFWNRELCSWNHWSTLEILALCSVISWSIQRLLDSELGLLESSLTSIIPEDIVLSYTEEKINSLSLILTE